MGQPYREDHHIDPGVDLINWVYREPLILPLGLTDRTPAGHRWIARVFLSLAAMVTLSALRLQGHMAWLGGVLIAACLLAAVRFICESKVPVYVQDRIPIVDVWEITPGVGIGPLRLGPPDQETARVLHQSAVVMARGLTVTCLLRHVDGWTAVMARARRSASSGRAPDPIEFESIERVITTCPAHLTPTGTRVGDALPYAMATLGVPEEVQGRVGASRRTLWWRGGLVAGLQANHIAWIGVFADARTGAAA